MNARNYQKELDRIIEKNAGTKPTLLLHSCCGPCSSSVLEYITQYFTVTLLWYNPNLFPEEEFERRYAAQVQVIEKMGLADRVKVVREPWQSERYYSRIKGLEDLPEGGARCTECFRLRLEEAAEYAAAHGFDRFCSTLTLSRHKDAARINRLGEEIAARTGIGWLPSDFKKRGREDRSLEICQQYGIYRQLYCGCEFSLRHREKVAEEKAAEEIAAADRIE